MQTFLPLTDFTASAVHLDTRRLGKQRIEAWQIYCALTVPGYGWQRHPAVNMWRGYEGALLVYGQKMCEVWRRRGYKDTMLDRFEAQLKSLPARVKAPHWLGHHRLHASHRSNLLRKDPAHYGKFNWPEAQLMAPLPYHWPVPGVHHNAPTSVTATITIDPVTTP